MTAIRVATWNLWWRFSDPERRRPAITAVLRELDADVVGLQEVWSLEGQDLASGHVLVGLGRGRVPVRVEGAGLFGTEAREGVWPSDHAGVVVDLRAGTRR